MAQEQEAQTIAHQKCCQAGLPFQSSAEGSVAARDPALTGQQRQLHSWKAEAPLPPASGDFLSLDSAALLCQPWLRRFSLLSLISPHFQEVLASPKTPGIFTVHVLHWGVPEEKPGKPSRRHCTEHSQTLQQRAHPSCCSCERGTQQPPNPTRGEAASTQPSFFLPYSSTVPRR